MNKSRINRALDHIDELIALCERELRCDARVQPARESLAYIRFIIYQYISGLEKINDVSYIADEIHASLRRINKEIDQEPKHIPLSLGP